ncbi:SOS response-associated peptidase [Mucilaginibacter gynuensis]|uniref:Abasic site processing protein n=1 Tax=Mucilaginibacter gynuensis TaxID=1302236 RepID=A0ABP8HN75_9SPHI
MCARYTLSSSEKEILAAYSATMTEPFTPTINARITERMPVITADEPDKIQQMHFQLVAHFAEGPKSVKATFNTRDDKIMESKLWRPLFVNHKRVLIPANGFYELDKVTAPQENQVYKFGLTDREIFSYAGLWSKWVGPGYELPYYSFSIITTESNTKVGNVHDKKRMPVILNKEDEALWLSKDVSPAQLMQLLKPYPDDLMYAERSSVRANTPGLIQSGDQNSL